MISQHPSKASASRVPNQEIDSFMVTNPINVEDHGHNNLQWDGRTGLSFFQFSGVLPSIQTLNERICSSMDLVQNPVSQAIEMRRQGESIDPQAGKERNWQDFASARGQGLSLTLGSQLPPAAGVPFTHMLGFKNLISGEEQREVYRDLGNNHPFCGSDGIDNIYTSSTMPQIRSGSASHGLEFMPTNIRNSRYIKPAQSLLDEVVSLRKCIEFEAEKEWSSMRNITHANRAGKHMSSRERYMGFDNEFSSDGRQDIRIRLTKLVSLLDEVDGRYERYCHQMEEVVSSFEVIAGLGAAKTYTALALHTMSKHFSRLRDAIISQINAVKRCLAKDPSRSSGNLSQLRLIDQQDRQKRALQQLGMVQIRQVLRPLRGLPENSVAILRAWLFEHFLHPYPDDSEKLMLATQTGLTRNQVSNWFINARVRLWKPMIEEMYKEEFAEGSLGSDPSSEGVEDGG